MANRRDVVKGLGAAALAGVAMPNIARAQGLTKISMGFGIRSINPIIINILIGSGLGYYKDEGLEFTARPLGNNSNAQIAVDKGDTQFAVGTPAFQMPLFAKNELPKIVNYYEYTYPYKWDVAVMGNSPLQTYEQLKGKKIGVSDLGTTDYPVTRAVFKNLGIDLTERWFSAGVIGHQYVVCQTNCPVSTVNNPTISYNTMPGWAAFAPILPSRHLTSRFAPLARRRPRERPFGGRAGACASRHRGALFCRSV